MALGPPGVNLCLQPLVSYSTKEGLSSWRRFRRTRPTSPFCEFREIILQFLKIQVIRNAFLIFKRGAANHIENVTKSAYKIFWVLFQPISHDT
jgi:hypothetical protein